MIEFQNVSKSFGGQTVIADVTFQINPGEHVGIVGPNGAGKTTIFSLITGDMQPDKGRVAVHKSCRLGYVHQQLNAHAITDALLEYVEKAMPELHEIEQEIHSIEHELSPSGEASSNRAPLLRRLGELQTRFEAMGGYALRNRAQQALSGMGFPIDSFDKPLRSFSGGWQSRAELARILIAQPDVLLLDEPSNYLDTPTVEWLQKYLCEFKGTLLLISHDRFLLNSLTTVTIEIANTLAERYSGNYDYYAAQRALRHEQRLAAQKNQDRKREKIERFIERFRAKNTIATQVQSRIKQLERMEEVVLPARIVSRGRLRLRPPPHCGAEVVRLEQAGLTYDGSRWVLRGLDLSISRGEKIALVGYNGLGKTTLLRMLAGGLSLSEGRRVLGHKVIIGYQSQDFAETMDPRATVFGIVKEVAADASDQEVRTLLGSLGFSGDAVEKPVEIISGGEKIRLAFARLLIRPPSFLVLDEPTTHLDIQAREALEQALRDFEGTICVVSHDIDFLRHVATGVIAMTPPGVTRYSGGYDYYREKVMGQMLSDKKQTRDDNKKEPSRTAPTPDRKELRRQRALARQELHAKTKELKQDIRRAEKQIETYEAEKAKLVEQLSGDPSKIDFAGLNKRLQFINDEISLYTSRWESAALELEKSGAAAG